MRDLKEYKAAIYVRLSKEDGDKIESDSIGNQKELIKDFLKTKPEIHVCQEMVDDGYSGVDFDRPAFLKMLEDIKSESINCVVVKDFSRLGRNYIETGRYIEKIFPFMGVRFISVNDNFDSANARDQSDNIMIPFKNLINDAYCRDISIKIRSQLEIKRKKGDFIGSFAVYGYRKSPGNKNRLEVDPFAASVVQDVFKWKLDGFSQQGIADRLNKMGVLSPMEYKKSIGLNYTTSFKANPKALWSAIAVGRILKNEIYTGVLEQGKKSTPNYKIKKQIANSKDKWVRVENSHEAIIRKDEFVIVSALLLKDTRIAPAEETVHLFSGMLFCSDCKQNLIRKTVPKNGKKYIYHVCATNKNGNGCSSHSISDKSLEKAVLISLQKRIAQILDLEQILSFIDTMPLLREEARKVEMQLQTKREELSRYSHLKLSLYEDMRDGLIDKEEYLELKSIYSKRCDDALADLNMLAIEKQTILNQKSVNCLWINHFKQFKDIEECNRKILVSLVEKIVVYEGKSNGSERTKNVCAARIEIQFKFQDDFQSAIRFVRSEEASRSVSERLAHANGAVM